MRYKKFGSTGKDISVLCLGTWALGGKQFGAVTQEDAVAAVHAMIDCGVNIVDTAPIYASGGSEEILGKALQGGYRDKVFLITKFGSEFVDPNDSDKGTIKDSSRKNMLKSIDASLKRLQTDYIDGYLMHWDDRVGTPHRGDHRLHEGAEERGEGALPGHVQSGARAGGPPAGRRRSGYCPVPLQYGQPRTKEDVLKYYAGQGCGTMGYGSLGGGILTRPVREVPTFGHGDMRLFLRPHVHRARLLPDSDSA